MKVVHVVNSDIRGGAAKAAYALSNGLRGIGVDSKMLVQRKFSFDENIFSVSNSFINNSKTNLRMFLDLLEIKIFTKIKRGRFSFGNIGYDITNNDLVQEADVIHLHWINEGYLSLKTLLTLKKLNKTIVWTLHDMWAFTGGCHYSLGCKRYLSICGYCPFLKFKYQNDFSQINFVAKKKLFNELKINFITCSEWLANIAMKTPLLQGKVIKPIHNTLDINIYKPLDKNYIREKLNLPKDKFLILFVAFLVEEERKGFHYLKDSLLYFVNKYPSLSNQVELIILGSSLNNQFKEIPLKINKVERLSNDKEIADYYNSANVFLAPSLEDNLPNTVLESLSCGTPVVAFNVGGILEMVEHKKNGYLAKEKSIEDLSNGIYWIIQNINHADFLRKHARDKIVSQFNPNLIAKNHLSFYQNSHTKINL